MTSSESEREHAQTKKKVFEKRQSMQGRKRDTALIWAARLGDFAEVKRLLLTTNANEWEVNVRKENALQVAAFKGHLHIVKWLVCFCGADHYTHASILPHAILGRQARVVEWCLGYSRQFALYNAQGTTALGATAMTPDARILESLCLAGAVFDESHLALALAHHNEPFLLKMMMVMPLPVIHTIIQHTKNSRVLRRFLELYPPRGLFECPSFVQKRAVGRKWLLANIRKLHNRDSKCVLYAAETGQVNIVKTAMRTLDGDAENSGYCLWIALQKRAWNLARWLTHKYSICEVWRNFVRAQQEVLQSLIRGNQLRLLRWFVEELRPTWNFAFLKDALCKRECFVYLWSKRISAINTSYNLLMDAVKLNQTWFLVGYSSCFDVQQQLSCFRYAIETNNVASILVFAHKLGINYHVPGQLRSSMIELIVMHDHVHLLRWFYPSSISKGNLLELACEVGSTKCAVWLFGHVAKKEHAHAIQLAIQRYRPGILDWIIANRLVTQELLRFVICGQQLTWLQKIIQFQPDLTQETLALIFNSPSNKPIAKEFIQVPVLEQVWPFHFDKGRAFEAAYLCGEVDSVRWLLHQRAHEGRLIDAVGCSPSFARVFLRNECFAFFPDESVQCASQQWCAGFEREVNRFVRKVYLAKFIMDKNIQKIVLSY